MPHQTTHSLHGGDNHGKFNVFAALGKFIGTPNSTDKDSAYVAEHPILKYFQAKLANFLNDFQLVWSVRAACIQRSALGGLLVRGRGAPLPYPGEVGREGRRWKVCKDGLRLRHDRVSLRLCSWQVRVC